MTEAEPPAVLQGSFIFNETRLMVVAPWLKRNAAPFSQAKAPSVTVIVVDDADFPRKSPRKLVTSIPPTA